MSEALIARAERAMHWAGHAAALNQTHPGDDRPTWFRDAHAALQELLAAYRYERACRADAEYLIGAMVHDSDFSDDAREFVDERRGS